MTKIFEKINRAMSKPRTQVAITLTGLATMGALSIAGFIAKDAREAKDIANGMPVAENYSKTETYVPSTSIVMIDLDGRMPLDGYVTAIDGGKPIGFVSDRVTKDEALAHIILNNKQMPVDKAYVVNQELINAAQGIVKANETFKYQNDLEGYKRTFGKK